MSKSILTKREKEVFMLLVKNRTTKEIADELGISEKTVRNHISNAMQKLGVKGRAQAVIELIKLKVIPAKTGYEELPYIPEKFVRHMIRGFFDGDGVACCTDKTKSFGFVGNGKIIDQLKDILNWHDVYAEPHWVTPNLYQMQTSSNKRLLNLYHYMYDNCSFYLTRKYEKFTRALNL